MILKCMFIFVIFNKLNVWIDICIVYEIKNLLFINIYDIMKYWENLYERER